MEFDSNVGGIAKAGLTTGIIGTSLGALNTLNGGMGGLLGGLLGGNNVTRVMPIDPMVSRYELGQEQKISELQSAIALRDANIYGDQKSLELYRYIDTQLNAINAQLASQAVTNQANKDSFQIMQERLECAKKELCCAINREVSDRKCADNTIVTYANATFYPKMVASVTTGTEMTAQTVYNPLPVDNCGCGC